MSFTKCLDGIFCCMNFSHLLGEITDYCTGAEFLRLNYLVLLKWTRYNSFDILLHILASIYIHRKLHFYSKKKRNDPVDWVINIGALGHADCCGKPWGGGILSNIITHLNLFASLLSCYHPLSFCSIKLFLLLHTKHLVYKWLS